MIARTQYHTHVLHIQSHKLASKPLSLVSLRHICLHCESEINVFILINESYTESVSPTSSFIYSMYFNSSIWILQLSIRKLSYFLTAPSQLLAFYYSRRAAEVTQINNFRSKLILANISSPLSFLFFLHYQHINCYNKLHWCSKILFLDREEK